MVYGPKPWTLPVLSWKPVGLEPLAHPQKPSEGTKLGCGTDDGIFFHPLFAQIPLNSF